MNALDEYDDNPEEALRDWVERLEVGDEVVRHYPRNMRGPILDIASSPHIGQTQYQIQFSGTAPWITAQALRENYRPGRVRVGPYTKPTKGSL